MSAERTAFQTPPGFCADQGIPDSSPRYIGSPAVADMAFCTAACSRGWSESDIAAELSSAYLSRDTSRSREAAYIRRTITKGLRWAA